MMFGNGAKEKLIIYSTYTLSSAFYFSDAHELYLVKL